MSSGRDSGVAQGGDPGGHVGGCHGRARRWTGRSSPANNSELPGFGRGRRPCHRASHRRVCDAGALAVGSEDSSDKATICGLCRGPYDPPGLWRDQRDREQLGGRRRSEVRGLFHGRRGGTSSSTRGPEPCHPSTASGAAGHHGSSVSGVGKPSTASSGSSIAGFGQSSAHKAFEQRRRRRAQRAGTSGSEQGFAGISSGASGASATSVGRRAGPRSRNGPTGGPPAQVGGGRGSRNIVGGRPDEACFAEDGAGDQKQKGSEASRPAQPRRQLGLRERGGRAELVLHQQRRPRNRSSRAVEPGDEKLSGCLFRADGGSHGQSGGKRRAVADGAHVVREELPQVQDGGVLFTGFCKRAPPPSGEQAAAGPPPGLEDYGSARAVSHRRELAGGFKAHGHGGATLGPLGHAGPWSVEATVCVQSSRGVHVDRGTHQRAQGGGVADEKEVCRSNSEAKGKRGGGGERRKRDREHRFLSWAAPDVPRRGAPLGEPHLKTGADDDAATVLGPLEFLEDWCRFLEGADLYRDPVPYPESGFLEGVMIDDHLGLQLLKRLPSMKRTLEQPARDQEVFASSASAYDYANLMAHPKKKQRRSLHVKAWGAEIEGGRGLVGPARRRLFALSRLSAESAKPGSLDLGEETCPRIPVPPWLWKLRTHIDVLCEWLEEFMITMFLEHKSRRAASDLALPGDHFDDEVIYVRMGQPKTRHRAAASQHVRVDHPGVASWVADVLPSTPAWRKIWNGSWAAFKLRFDALQTEVLESTPCLPSSLRPGAATFLFRSWDENLPRLQWRGRWKSFRMLETYVQELGATEVKVGTLLCLQFLA
ncbi:unnamed protein product [Symbiodinium microadriaticum]|nr:unnamed protein product [Symbiodinium microadriaticum]